MATIQQIDKVTDSRAFIERVWYPSKSKHIIVDTQRRFGVFKRSIAMVGKRGRCHEKQPWEFDPQTQREAEIFRAPREDRGKHLTRFVPCATAPVVKVESFYERNMRQRYPMRYR